MADEPVLPAITEQATIGARTDTDPASGRPAGWWAVTDAGTRLFVPEDALGAPVASDAENLDAPLDTDASRMDPHPGLGRLRTVRSGQRVLLRRRGEGTDIQVDAVGLPILDPQP